THLKGRRMETKTCAPSCCICPLARFYQLISLLTYMPPIPRRCSRALSRNPC
ncbi:hypothetical protein B0H10DRAFT_2129307, partial [Mycena sp. CBHHK59/15]